MSAWRETRARILARAKQRCEQCRKRNGDYVETYTGKTILGGPAMYWRLPGKPWTTCDGQKVGFVNPRKSVFLRLA